MNGHRRLGALVFTLFLGLPLLNGCAAMAIASAVFPVVVGGGAMMAEDRSPFRVDKAASTSHTDKELDEFSARIRKAECGDASSQFWLASALQNQFNTTPNSIEIYKWYRLAQIGDHADADAPLAELDETMYAAEIEEARERARIWQPATQGCPT